jgi:hypothetical protein
MESESGCKYLCKVGLPWQHAPKFNTLPFQIPQKWHKRQALAESVTTIHKYDIHPNIHKYVLNMDPHMEAHMVSLWNNDEVSQQTISNYLNSLKVKILNHMDQYGPTPHHKFCVCWYWAHWWHTAAYSALEYGISKKTVFFSSCIFVHICACLYFNTLDVTKLNFCYWW